MRQAAALLGAVALLGGLGGEIANTWKWPPWAATGLFILGIAGLVPLLHGEWTEWRQEQERAETSARLARKRREREIQRLLASQLRPGGRLPTAPEASPYAVIGVSKSRYSGGTSDPPYVPRVVDEALDKALAEQQRFVVVVGMAAAGKSRTAFEAVRRTLPAAPLLVPCRGPDVLERLLALDPPLFGPGPTVLWLDDLDDYVGGLTTSLLERLADHVPPIVTVGTIRSRWRDEVLGRPGEVGRSARQLFDRAVTVFLDSSLQDSERADAERLYPAEDFSRGIGEQLIGAPTMERRYDDAQDRNPAGWALVQAAIDWRRAGLTRPIPEPCLRDLWPAYAREARTGIDPSDQLFKEALSWAQQPVAARIALLELVEEHPVRSFRAFDYIVAYADGQNRATAVAIPSATWKALLDRVDAPEAVVLGLTAISRGNAEFGVVAIDQASASEGLLISPHAPVWAALAPVEAAAHAGDPRDAREAIDRALRSGDPEIAAAAGHLDRILAHEGDPESAAAAVRQATASGSLPVVSAARSLLSVVEQWSEDTAQASYQHAVASGDPARIAVASLTLGSVLAADGNVDRAREALERAAGSRHPDAAPHAANRLGLLLASARDTPAAARYYQLAIDSGHFDAAPKAAIDLASIRLAEGDDDEARSLWEQVVQSKHVDMAPGAAFNLGLFHEEHGELELAQKAYQRAVAFDHAAFIPKAAFKLGLVLEQQDDLEAAGAAYLQALQAGDPKIAAATAQRLLDSERFDEVPAVGLVRGVLLQQQGESAAATAAFRRVIHSEDPEAAPPASVYLGLLLQQSGELDKARAAYQWAVDSGHPDAAPVASELLAALPTPAAPPADGQEDGTETPEGHA